MTTYKIENPNGLSGRVWSSTYASWDDAAEAIRRAYDWDGVVLSDTFTDDDGEACCAYATQDDCDRDGDGSRAPWIIEIAA